jgi:hypothetical protein
MSRDRIMTSRRPLRRALAAAVCLWMSPAAASAAADGAAALPLSLRITPGEYRQSIADIFGPGIAITGRFEPEERDEGLLAVGARSASISADGMERYDSLARGIAAQVVDAQHRGTLFSCKPEAENRSDDGCARQFIAATGRLLYRRSLSEDEIQQKVRVASAAAAVKRDFYTGMAAVLSDMLLSPNFLYRYKKREPDPHHPGQVRLDAHSKAAVLSFYLWNSTPDDLLLKAAETGELQTKEGLRWQVDRMTSSPSIEDGVRAFFADMLGFNEFEILAKDPTFFPRFTPKVIDQAQEQTLRTIVNHLIARQGDYRDLFTTSNTFLTKPLAAVYNVPLVDTSDNGQPDHWIPHTYPPGDPRSGILSQVSFVALHSPAGRTSPTGRGKALREYILCETVPPPPGNVDFKFVQDTTNPKYKTTRERLTAHRSEAMCAGCHKITDPIGLALENFDSAGGYRTRENDATIDASGELGGIKFDGPVGLAKAVHDDPALTSCVAKRSFAFGAGRSPSDADAEWVRIQHKFADSHYNFIELLRQIALSDVLYTVPSSPAAAAARP